MIAFMEAAAETTLHEITIPEIAASDKPLEFFNYLIIYDKNKINGLVSL